MPRPRRRRRTAAAPISPLYLPYISPTSPLHLPYISRVSPRLLVACEAWQYCLALAAADLREAAGVLHDRMPLVARAYDAASEGGVDGKQLLSDGQAWLGLG